MNNDSTVCILTAGKGTRMGALGTKLNKSLHVINGKAVITHIIDKFTKNTNFVIALGFLGSQVKNYVSIAHPNIKVTFVDVENFEGEGSGPGLSLLSCIDYLQKPFYFVSCDTLWSDNINQVHKENWVGVSKVNSSESKHYCNFNIINNEVRGIVEKKKVYGDDYSAFIGLCFINNYTEFWNGIKKRNLEAGEHQISSGLRELISKCKVNTKYINWEDVGDQTKFKKIASKYENFDFSKNDEVLYIYNNKVIKFFSDANITLNRVSKTSLNPKVFPKITSHKNQFYSYNFVNGETLYKNNSEKIFTYLLQWLLDHLWIDVNVSHKKMREACYKFYKVKTLERLGLYNSKYPNANKKNFINDIMIPKVDDLIKEINWEIIFDGKAVFFHGDLNFDNIIYNSKSNKFCLIDWRQDFAGNIEFGDIYYDLAKLYGGIILNYDLIKLNLFSYQEENDYIYFDFAQRYKKNIFLKILENFIKINNFDLSKVKLLVGITYLNMAPLHKYPYDKLVYSLGKTYLYKFIKEIRI